MPDLPESVDLSSANVPSPRARRAAAITLMVLGLLAAVAGSIGAPSPTWRIPLRAALALGAVLMAAGSLWFARLRGEHP